VGDSSSDYPAISADGNVVSFQSQATNLVAGDTNGVVDVFVHDRAAGTTERVSVDSAGAQSDGNSSSSSLGLSPDGRFVAFDSVATNLVAGDTNLDPDVFVRDRTAATTTRVSVDSSGLEGNGSSAFPGISPDGELVAFASDADDFVNNDTNNLRDIFVRNRCVAIASHYGTGWAGTLAIPTIDASADPVLGSTLTVTTSNSRGVDTPGVVLIGLAEANLITSKGGTLLVDPLLFVPLLIHASGEGLSGTLPNDPALCEVEVDVQALELDPGASNGLSFTAGLKLLLGF
jgi:hypothetical protein